MTRVTTLLTMLVAAVAFSLPPTAVAQSQSAQAQLQAAITKETVERDLKGAIEIYTRLAGGRDRAVAAKALLRMAGCKEKLGDAEARKDLERIVNEFKDQPEAVAEARSRLAANAPALTATPERFPSEVVVRPQAAVGLTNRRTLANGDEVATRQSGSDQRRQISLVLVSSRGELELARLAALPRGFELEPSPDGAYVAVIVSVSGAATGAQEVAPREELVVVSTRGKVAPIVAPLSAGGSSSQANRYRPLLQWSPDSRWLAFAAGAYGLVEFKVLRAATGAVTSLGFQGDGPPDFQWSPTGDQLALHITQSSSQTDDIAIVTIATGIVRRLASPAVPTSTGARTRLAAWTGVGLFVHTSPTAVLASDNWLVNTDDGRARKTCSGGPIQVPSVRRDGSLRGGTWDDCLGITRDGRSQLVWLRQSERLVFRDTSTGQDRTLTQGSGEEYAGYLSPDDRVAVFLSNRDGYWGLYGVLLGEIPATNPTLIFRMDGQPAGLEIEWTPDGMVANISYYETNINRVAMASGKSAGGLMRLTQSTASNRAPSFSADGRRIAYWAGGTRFGLSLMDSDGANERRISDQQFIRWHQAPMWSSDFEVIVEGYQAERAIPFVHQIVDIRNGLARDISVPRAVFPEALDSVNVSGLSFIPARRELAYIDRDVASTGQIIRARAMEGGGERVLARFPDGGVHAFAVTSTGSQIAYSRFTKDGQCPCELGVLNTESGERRVFETLPNPQVPVAWSPDGRFLLYGATRPRIMDTVAGKSWTLMESAQQPTWLQEGSWSPDGTAIALTVSSNRSETRRWKALSAGAIARAIQSGGR